jgi:hypothetical protein
MSGKSVKTSDAGYIVRQLSDELQGTEMTVRQKIFPAYMRHVARTPPIGIASVILNISAAPGGDEFIIRPIRTDDFDSAKAHKIIRSLFK